MICASIADCTVEECIGATRVHALAEVRIDRLEGVSEEGIRKIFSSKGRKGKLVAACRPNPKMDDAKRKALLLAAISAGADYVDIEVESSDAYERKIVEKAKSAGCKIIVSYHNYEKTPAWEELKQVVRWCLDSGADIAKVACKANSERDCVRLLSLLDSENRMIVVGMGKKGEITRVVAPLLGSLFTYAPAFPGKETAEGQIPKDELEKRIRSVSDGKA